MLGPSFNDDVCVACLDLLYIFLISLHHLFLRVVVVLITLLDSTPCSRLILGWLALSVIVGEATPFIGNLCTLSSIHDVVVLEWAFVMS